MWFRRSDGQLFEATEGTETFALMSKDGAFEEVENPHLESQESLESLESRESKSKTKK
jgi:hypothetical protein